MVALATVEDVETRLGREFQDPKERAQVEAWIGDVQGIVLARLPSLPGRIVPAGPLSAEVVAAVVANAVIRKVKNPDGKQNERIDDYSYGLTADAARGELFLTDDEWALLSPDVGNSGAFSIRTWDNARKPGWWVTPTVWVPEP